MGIVFKTCNACGYNFPDCGSYVHCNDNCYSLWCSDSCAESQGYISGELDEEWDDYPDASCSFCRSEVATNDELLNYALKKLGMSRDTLQKEYLSK